jgi:hypothetical protein
MRIAAQQRKLLTPGAVAGNSRSRGDLAGRLAAT